MNFWFKTLYRDVQKPFAEGGTALKVDPGGPLVPVLFVFVSSVRALTLGLGTYKTFPWGAP